jgi:SseB protein N-terminal domain
VPERAAGPRGTGRTGGPAADSAGRPWAGRTLEPSAAAGDDGAPDPGLAAALAGPDPRGEGLPGVVAALAGARLLVPLLATEGEDGDGGGGGAAEMALPHLRGRDGRTALPVFSGVAALAAWDAAARPVPVDARRAALAAVGDGCDVLVVDPAGPAVVVPRPAVEAVAQARPWTPSPRDPEVAAAVTRALSGLPDAVGVSTAPGRRAELAVVLTLRPGLDATALDALTREVSARLAADVVVAARVDSLELRLLSADR